MANKGENMAKQLALISGPSGTGKGPALDEVLKRLASTIQVGRIVLYTSRPMRAGEIPDVTFHYLTAEQIKNLDPNRYIIGQVRLDWQAIDLEEVKTVLANFDLVIVEVYPTLGQKLLEWLKLHQEFDSFEVKTIAMVPMSNEEMAVAALICGTTMENALYLTMRGKLERRASKSDTPEQIQSRASLAYTEIQMMKDYQHHIVNHIGEDNKIGWSKPLCIEADRVVQELVSVIQHVEPNHYRISWHDYEDGCSLNKIIEVKKGDDPEQAAENHLRHYLKPNMYELEAVTLIDLTKKDNPIKKWRIEVGPVFEGPGPGDGSDASFDVVIFVGTKEEMKQKAEAMCLVYSGYNPDIGHCTTSYSATIED